MVITAVATSSGSRFLFVLGAVQKSCLFSVFAHLGCDGWGKKKKKVFRLKGKIGNQKTLFDLKGKKVLLFSKMRGLWRSSKCYSTNTTGQIICTNNMP